MSTAFDLIADGFLAVLSAPTAVSTDIKVDEMDEDPVAGGKADAVRINLDTSDPQLLGGMHGNPVDWETVVHVDCFASVAGASARAACNTVAKAAYAKLAANKSLGIAADAGVYIGEPKIVWATDKAATRLARATLTYRVTHRTANQTLD